MTELREREEKGRGAIIATMKNQKERGKMRKLRKNEL
jgi:hypothetical protein